MPFYGRRYRRYRRYKRFYRRYGRYGRRSYARRYVNASSRSIARIKTSFVETSTISAGYGTTPGDVYYTTPFAFASSPGSLARSLLYRQYCNLYEEVKIVGVKVAVAVVTPVGDVSTPSLQIYTAWDRKRGSNEGAPTADAIVQSSTYNVATALNNNVAKLSRSCYASDLMEKAMFLDSTLAASPNYNNLAWVAAGQNPTFFHPSFMMTTISPSLGAAHNITVSVSFTYYVAFRNPKFGGGASSAKIDDLGAVVRGAAGPDDAGGDLALEDDIDDVASPSVEHVPSQLDVAPVEPAAESAARRQRHAVEPINPGPLAAGEKRYGPRRPKNV